MSTTEIPYTTSIKTGSGFIEDLTRDLSKSNLEIPGFPDIAVRINDALRDENVAVRDIVALIQSEPGLVSRILQTANSAAFNTSSTSIADLKTAINRIGFKMLFSIASSYAIHQIEQQESLKPIRPWLAEIWQSSNNVAAITFVVAKKSMAQLANEAMVAGLLHRVGNLYLLVHAQQRNIDIQSDETWEASAAKWHSTIASEMLRQWELPAHVADAVGQQDALATGNTDGAVPFSMLLSAAKLHDRASRQDGDEAEKSAKTLAGVELWGQKFIDIVADGQEEIKAIRSAIT